MSRDIVIVTGRCARAKQGFGIRFEGKGRSQWAATWAFPIKEAAARREGYDKTRIDGEFVTDPGFPGCPHCKANAFFLCGCGKLACWDGETRTVTCPWCNQRGELSGTITSLTAGGDR